MTVGPRNRKTRAERIEGWNAAGTEGSRYRPRPLCGDGARYEWIRALQRTDLPSTTRLVGITLVLAGDADGKKIFLGVKKLPGASLPWPAWCERFIHDRLPLVRRGTRAAYLAIIRNHLEPSFASNRTHQIDVPMVQSWVVAQARAGVKPSTIRNRTRLLRTMLGAAMRAGLAATAPPPRSIEFPRASSIAITKAERGWTDTERRALVDAPGPEWRRVLFRLLAETGVRIGEALGLEWKHIDRTELLITIRQASSCGEIGALKTKTSVRDVPISRALFEQLEQHRAGRQFGLVFPNAHGRPRWSSGVRKHHLQPLCRALGLRELSLHGFRHSCATSMLASGVSAEAAREVLGHGSLTMTQEYAAASTTDRRRAVEAVARTLNSVPASETHAEQ